MVVDRAGAEERFTADVVVVSCGAANSAKLLLQSANDRHPNGLANGSDQVGRNYMFHDSTAVLALSREENETAYQVAGAAVPRARSVRPGGVAERILEVV